MYFMVLETHKLFLKLIYCGAEWHDIYVCIVMKSAEEECHHEYITFISSFGSDIRTIP